VKKYEAMFLLDSGYVASHWKEAVEEITGILKRHDCEIVRLVKWDDRKLAYQIGPHKRGTYVLSFFKAPHDALGKIERDVQLSENLVRVLVVRRDKMTEEAMLRYAVPCGEANVIGEALKPEPVAAKAPEQPPPAARTPPESTTAPADAVIDLEKEAAPEA
jgi:small subunit ribosomal protein S6